MKRTKPFHPRSVVGGLFCCLVALASVPCGHAIGDQPAVPQALNAATPRRPVILLTGFEPFGKRRLPNPSWEGIKSLDGQEWKGHQLVCKQLPVVWGAPLEQLQDWVSQYQPVAIFSFGQGGKGAFALESKASNKRSRAKDNRGERPPAPTIVKDGPTYFQASIDCEKFACLLSKKGHETRVSTVAGRYLCEEALYSLEYLKTTRQLPATVSFCHVPPLGTQVRLEHVMLLLSSSLWPAVVTLPAQIPDKHVTVEDVRQFVQDMLETWHAVHRSPTPRGPVEPVSQRKSEDPRHQQIKEFISRYFRTWSEQDMKGYDACFLPDACIQHIDAQDRLTTSSRSQFIASQRDYHRNATHRTTEVAESMDIRLEEKLARVVVYWKLTAGPRTEWGYDHFTLMQVDGGWRIVNLVFYSAAKKVSN